MKILVLTTTAPDGTTPEQTGTTNFELRLLQLLAQTGDVTLWMPSGFEDPALAPAGIRSAPYATDNRWGFLRRFVQSVRLSVYPSMWHRLSSEIPRRLRELQRGDFDVCWLLDDYAGPYLRGWPAFLPAVFVRHFVLSMGAGVANAAPLTWRQRYHARLGRRFDAWTTRAAHATTTGTPESVERLRQFAPGASVHYLPTMPGRTPARVPEEVIRRGPELIVAYVGDLTFERNLDGVAWLLGRVLPLLRAESLQRMRFRFIGRLRPEDRARLPVCAGAQVEFAGFVEDLEAELQRCQAAVIPVFGGNGVRIKSLTLLGAALPTVATRDGLEGLPVHDGREVLVADDPAGFAAALTRLLDEELRCELSARCHAAVSRFISAGEDSARLMAISEAAIAAARSTRSDS